MFNAVLYALMYIMLPIYKFTFENVNKVMALRVYQYAFPHF